MAKKTAGRRQAARRGEPVGQKAASTFEQFSIPPLLVEQILLGPADDRRVLQDSPLLGDVWAAYAANPGAVQDLLITPRKDASAADVAYEIAERLKSVPRAEGLQPGAKVAYLQGIVGAELHFNEVLRILVPLTQWWSQKGFKSRIEEVMRAKLARVLDPARFRQAGAKIPVPVARDRENFSSLERYIALAGLIYWMSRQPPPADGQLDRPDLETAFARYAPHIPEIVEGMFGLYEVVQQDSHAVAKADRKTAKDRPKKKDNGLIFQVSLNRPASAALDRSVPAVKGDAAQTLFKVNCEAIVWAVLDSGIDGTHDAFMTPAPKKADRVSRVTRTLDFTRIREIVSNSANDVSQPDRKRIADATGLSMKEIDDRLQAIAADADKKRPTNWDLVEELITLAKPPPPASPHGTHVAGIIGARRIGEHAGGMCPDIQFYDFRVLGRTLKDTEFAIIAALQYIRYVNEQHNYITIHGANLSLSIPHNVRNYACGRTPVCNECERLIESGVVVVAAAGNHGFQKFETKDGSFESYAAFSITDPGNGDGVITVGSTHGGWPQTYGVSFFSSRGPTGDGRLKPDLVAPGERVMSTVPGQEWASESGTSMAAPHVSGAAAMLLARYEELIGQPRRLKRILCESATDLGRERSFQGHGMLDVLRAFQSI